MIKKCFIPFLALVIFTIYGCATTRINLSKSDTVKLEKTASEKVFIPWADAYKDGNDLLVTGVVERRYLSTGLLKAHIDVTILSVEGTILQEGHTKAIYVPGRRVGKGINWERFRIRFPGIPPEGAKIKMVVEHGEHVEKLPG
ncbi:MAG: hypothetical protein MUP16_11180 [Sedimentisphaerales bacterium]|nr:hypothetical protein [Sedimentisphaerales bacterium]